MDLIISDNVAIKGQNIKTKKSVSSCTLHGTTKSQQSKPCMHWLKEHQHI